MYITANRFKIFFVLLFPFILNAQQEIDEILNMEDESTIQLERENNAKEIDNVEFKKVSELSQLVPFNDIAIIQKNYLPQTGRLEFYPNLGFILNDAFFINTQFGARLAYYLTEQWGLEFSSMILSRTDKKVTEDLREDTGLNAESLVVPKNYFGLDIKWAPVYGKMSLLNSKIVPYGMYFSLGAGSMKLDSGDAPSTIHVGTGQTYAINKSWAFRWDASCYFYEAESSNGTAKSYFNIYLTAGVSMYFPEASYR